MSEMAAPEYAKGGPAFRGRGVGVHSVVIEVKVKGYFKGLVISRLFSRFQDLGIT